VGTCRRRNTHKIEELSTSFYSKNSTDRGISQIATKKFFDIYSPIETESILKGVFNVRDYLSLDEFRLLALACCKKTKLRPHCLSELKLAVPKYRKLMSLFKSYTEIQFNEETDNELLLELWKQAFPDTIPIPEIPSKQWEALGFQGSNPATDFRGSGRCGIDCLLALVQNYHPFNLLKHSAEKHNIPFAIAGINVVMICYEFIGWGFKSPRVPSGRNPETYEKLCKLLFSDVPENVDMNLEFVKKNFFKVYFLIFCTLMEVWEDINGSYFDFPRILLMTEDLIESKLQQFGNIIELDNYLIKKLMIEGRLLQTADYIRICLADDSIKFIPIESLTMLSEVMNSIICMSYEIGYSNCLVYDSLGKEITDHNILITSIQLQTIYYYPMDRHASLITKVSEQKGFVKDFTSGNNKKNTLKREYTHPKSRLGISSPPAFSIRKPERNSLQLKSTISTPNLRPVEKPVKLEKPIKRITRGESLSLVFNKEPSAKPRAPLKAISSLSDIKETYAKSKPPLMGFSSISNIKKPDQLSLLFLKSDRTISSPNLLKPVPENNPILPTQQLKENNQPNPLHITYSKQNHRRKKSIGENP